MFSERRLSDANTNKDRRMFGPLPRQIWHGEDLQVAEDTSSHPYSIGQAFVDVFANCEEFEHDELREFAIKNGADNGGQNVRKGCIIRNVDAKVPYPAVWAQFIERVEKEGEVFVDVHCNSRKGWIFASREECER